MISAKDCDVLLLAAGYGKRLLPLTATTPKPLLKVGGKSLIHWNLELIKRAGFSRVFINLHHLGEQIAAFVADGSRWGIEVEYSRETALLDTGGGIKFIESRLSKPYLVTLNSDSLFGKDFSFEPLFFEQSKGALASLVLRPDALAKSYGSVFANDSGRIVRFLDVHAPGTEDETMHEAMYTGIQILSRELIQEMPPAGEVFSITKDTYREIIRRGGILRAAYYLGYWSDVGTPDRLEKASKSVAQECS